MIYMLRISNISAYVQVCIKSFAQTILLNSEFCGLAKIWPGIRKTRSVIAKIEYILKL